MGQIFISHSSRNNDWAVRVRDWLANNGWNDIFLDLDPERGIAAGERWKSALQKAAHRCEVVLALVSPEWLASSWSRSEVDAARLLNKKVIIALIGTHKADLPIEFFDEQWIDLVNDPEAFVRLKHGLKRAGLDPSSFPFPSGRRPYPGFAPLDEEDAAIFFGREAQIVRGLDKLRGLSRTRVERMFVIIGASGSGKSSFLRAGLLPRLRRDDLAWLPLPVIRPERGVLTGKFGLTQSLRKTLTEARFEAAFARSSLPQTTAALEEYVATETSGLVNILDFIQRTAADSALFDDRRQATIIIPIDQAEELFNVESLEETRLFIRILSRAIERCPNLIVLSTIRSDAFARFQGEPTLALIPKEIFTLDAMLQGSYKTIIEGPALLARPPLKIDPELTDQLLRDISGQDALPLLAFTLAYLYDRYRANNSLTLAGYVNAKGVRGVIEQAVTGAIAAGISGGELPSAPQDLSSIVRKAFIPHLASIDASGQFSRRLGIRSEIPKEALPLVQRLIDARLLVSDWRTVGGTEQEVIEVAHEYLLHQWGMLSEALKADREFLIWQSRFEQSRLLWESASPYEETSRLLSGQSLLQAAYWLKTRRADFGGRSRQYIYASLPDFLEFSISPADRLKLAGASAALAAIAAAAAFGKLAILTTNPLAFGTGLAGLCFFLAQHLFDAEQKRTKLLNDILQRLYPDDIKDMIAEKRSRQEEAG